ncbi:hypothetical protein APR04_003092 [Promicromonospora umidemergens]|uniref:PRC-barrel domain-containing protein n=1 Tax=Promicromonospora umidemergens TaxID=629679 RepID=A0ABP8XY58_9MICO|nr:PRC-barrel domain-containing protein [Promicromonospora umidemergens]MCP2284172.1 hypothetical protein [Promicromonospora umidemergens]
MGTAWDPWNFTDRTGLETADRNLVGFEVHATDGDIGKIDDASIDVDTSHVVVDTGPWIFGQKVILPAGTITRIDWDAQIVHVDLTKDQIKDSPPLENRRWGQDVAYQDQLGGYYGGLYSRGI